MKTNNIFDLLDTESTVAENTFITDTGVSTEKVTQLVKEAIKMNSSKVIPMKKKSKKAFRLTALIAAAVTASIVTASAMGSFNQAFGSLFAGESIDGIYAGSDISIESENTNVEFIGIAGDQFMAAASMKLTRSSGEKYVDDITDTWISASSTYILNDHPTYLYGNTPDEEINYTYPKWFELKYPMEVRDSKREDVQSTYGFYFDDCSTISAYIFSTSAYGYLKGETMTASADSLSAYTVKETLYDYSEHTADNNDSYGFRTNVDFSKSLASIINDYGTDEKDGLRVMVNPETHDIVLAKETPLDISFTLSVKMNYKYSKNVYQLTNLSQCYDSWKNGAEGTVTITPYNMILNVKVTDRIPMTYDMPEEDLGEFGYLPYDPEAEVKVKMSNGDTISAYEEGFIDNSAFENGDFNNRYQFYTDDNGDGKRLHPIAINPDDIDSIVVNNIVVYKK